MILKASATVITENGYVAFRRDASDIASLQLRSTWNILWSCICTIFACTWVSIHPNSPGLRKGKLDIFLRRLELTMWTLLIPEMTLYWALRQWLGARRLAEFYKDFEWTKTHGHFLQMGGFVLADSNGRVEVITDEHFYDLLDKGSISFPDVSKDQICSLSRGDGLSKLIVVGQTSWFIAQCISRAIMSVGLTGLELVTLAFAFLNGLMYFLWWDKPLDAEYHIRIYPCSRPAPVPLPAWIDPLSPTTQILSHGQPEAGGSAAVNSNLQNTTLTQPRQDATKSSFYVHSGHVSPGAKDHIMQDRVSRLREAFLFGWKRLSQMRGSHYTLDSPVTEIPTFYALPHRITAIPACNMAIAVIGVMFGAIHCAGWNLGFPTQEEKVLWRVCAVVVSTLPVLMVFHATLLMIGGIPTFLSGARHKGIVIIGEIFWKSLPVYFIARIILLTEAFITLRDLPKEAFVQVNWTRFLPHI